MVIVRDSVAGTEVHVGTGRIGSTERDDAVLCCVQLRRDGDSIGAALDARELQELLEALTMAQTRVLADELASGRGDVFASPTRGAG